jgi:hypothetical protein
VSDKGLIIIIKDMREREREKGSGDERGGGERRGDIRRQKKGWKN